MDFSLIYSLQYSGDTLEVDFFFCARHVFTPYM
jgi:hypothetical protein